VETESGFERRRFVGDVPQGQHLDARSFTAPEENVVVPDPDLEGPPEGAAPNDSAPGALGESHVGKPSADLPLDPDGQDLEFLADPRLRQSHDSSRGYIKITKT
jgi:hypothetical protein